MSYTQPKLLSWLLTIYIASLVVFQAYYYQIGHILGFVLFIVTLYTLYIDERKSIELNYVVISYFLFATFAIASVFWSIDFNISMNRSLQLYYIAVFLLIIYNIFIKFDLENSLLNGILFGSFVNYLYFLKILPEHFPLYADGRALGTTENPNILALFMVFSIFSSIWYLLQERSLNKIFYYYQYVNIFLAYYVILLTASKKAIIIAPLLIVAYLLVAMRNQKRLYRLGLVSIVAIIALLQVIDFSKISENLTETEKRFEEFQRDLTHPVAGSSTTERQLLIKEAFAVFTKHPFVGTGLDTFALQSTPKLYAHNNYVEILADLGIVGFMIFYSIYFYLVKRVRRIFDPDIKFILFMTISSLLFIEIGTVSYSIKLYMIFLILITVLVEKYSNEYASEEERYL